MKLREVLNNPLIKLPISWKDLGYKTYYDCLIQRGGEYLKLLQKLDEDELKENLHFIGQISKNSLINGSTKMLNAVIHTVRVYLDKGDPHEAFEEFNKHLKPNEIEANSSKPIFYLETDNIWPYHYRLRVSEEIPEKKDLFHVPFEIRHKISSNRYSIPGYPTLYLSNSVYTAYKELGEPEIRNLYVAKFEHSQYFNKRESLLDVRSQPQFDDIDYNYKFLGRWPLLLSCSMEVGYPDSNFSPEYIIPQILMKWSLKNVKVGGRNLIGVSYTSSKIDLSKKGNIGQFYNTAIPVRHAKPTGYCSVLTKLFNMTEPLSFKEGIKSDIEIGVQSKIKSIEIFGATVKYTETDFGRIEEVLSNPPYLKRTSIYDE